MSGDPDLARLSAGFEEARSAAPDRVVEADLRLAGRPVRATIVGEELARRALAPFAHLRAEANGGQPESELTIELWDGETAGVGLQFEEDLGVRRGAGSGEVMVASYPGIALTAIDRRTPRIVGWRRSAEQMPVEERWRPLPGILPFWYIDRGVNVLHAAMAGRDGEGVLIVGPSGAGKSATALACAAAGMEVVGDDQVGIEEADGGYRGHMLFATARLWPQMLEEHPRLACGGATEPLIDGKLLVIPGPQARMRPSARVRGMVVLRTGAERPGVVAATPGEALRASVPYSLVGVVGGGRWGMARIGELVRRLPLRALEVADGPEQAAELVDAALAELRAEVS
jgi:hypothetical protein